MYMDITRAFWYDTERKSKITTEAFIAAPLWLNQSINLNFIKHRIQNRHNNHRQNSTKGKPKHDRYRHRDPEIIL